MILLDTDIFTLYQLGNLKVVARFHAANLENQIALPIFTRIQALQGRFDSLLKAADKKELLQAMARLRQLEVALGTFKIVEVDEAVADEFEKLLSNKKLRKIGRADLLIASIVLANKALLVTRNVRHFEQVPGLRIENWAA